MMAYAAGAKAIHMVLQGASHVRSRTEHPLFQSWPRGDERWVTVDIKIYRLEHDPQWALEVINDEGTSTVWDALFDTDDGTARTGRSDNLGNARN
jgi:hypothetical protein